MPFLFVCEANVHEKVHDPLISVQLFKAHLVPVIIKLYLVKNLQLRLILLEFLPYYCKFVGRDQLAHQLVPAIKIGLRGMVCFR